MKWYEYIYIYCIYIYTIYIYIQYIYTIYIYTIYIYTIYIQYIYNIYIYMYNIYIYIYIYIQYIYTIYIQYIYVCTIYIYTIYIYTCHIYIYNIYIYTIYIQYIYIQYIYNIYIYIYMYNIYIYMYNTYIYMYIHIYIYTQDLRNWGSVRLWMGFRRCCWFEEVYEVSLTGWVVSKVRMMTLSICQGLWWVSKRGLVFFQIGIHEVAMCGFAHCEKGWRAVNLQVIKDWGFQSVHGDNCGNSTQFWEPNLSRCAFLSERNNSTFTTVKEFHDPGVKWVISCPRRFLSSWFQLTRRRVSAVEDMFHGGQPPLNTMKMNEHSFGFSNASWAIHFARGNVELLCLTTKGLFADTVYDGKTIYCYSHMCKILWFCQLQLNYIEWIILNEQKL